MFVHTLNPLIQIGPITLRYYGILFFVGFVIAFLVTRKIAEENGFGKDNIDAFFLIAVISTLIGIRLFHVFVYSWDYFKLRPLEILFFWKGGLSSHGAIIGLFIGAYIFTHVKKLSFYKLLDAMAIGVLIGPAITVRLGNFINGELVGSITSLPWGVKFPKFDWFRHPVQLYQAMYNFSIFLILMKFRKYKFQDGFIFYLGVTLWTISRFLVEFLRDPASSKHFYFLTTAQFASLLIFIPAVIMLFWNFKKKLNISII